VSALHVYPCKGLRGHSVQLAELDANGLHCDRRYMIVELDDADPVAPGVASNLAGQFHSQRSLPAMATLTACVLFTPGPATAAALAAAGRKSADFPVPPRLDDVPTALLLGIDRRVNAATGVPDSVCIPIVTGAQASAGAGGTAVRPVRVWRSTLEGVDQGDAASAFLSAALLPAEELAAGRSLRLVYLDPTWPGCVRAVATKWLPPWFFSIARTVGFADGFPVLLASTASLADLNARMHARHSEEIPAIPMGRFRPNVVVSDGPAGVPLDPWEEETWLRMGVEGPDTAVVFRGVKRCERCLVTTTDQSTGGRGTGEPLANEPLATLASYRASVLGAGEGVFFAINLVHELPPTGLLGGIARLLGARGSTKRLGLQVGATLAVETRGVMGPA
jgi:uncharacterized protein YcbX